MRRNWKRILSLLLTVAMVFTMNTSVFATEPTATATGEDQQTVEAAAETTESTAAETVEETKETNSEATSETTEESKTEETAATEEVATEAAPAETTMATVEETPAVEETATVAEEATEAVPVEEAVVAETEAVVEEAGEVTEAKTPLSAKGSTDWTIENLGTEDVVWSQVDGVDVVSFNKAPADGKAVIIGPKSEEEVGRLIISSDVAIKVSLNGTGKVNYVSISKNTADIEISGNSAYGTVVRKIGALTADINNFKAAADKDVYIFAEPTEFEDLDAVKTVFDLSENSLYYKNNGELVAWGDYSSKPQKIDGTDKHKITATAGAEGGEIIISGDKAVYKMTVSAPEAVQNVYVSVNETENNKVTVSAESVGDFPYTVKYKESDEDEYTVKGDNITEEKIKEGVEIDNLKYSTNYTFVVSANGTFKNGVIYTNSTHGTKEHSIGAKSMSWGATEDDISAYYISGGKKMSLTVSEDKEVEAGDPKSYRVTVSTTDAVIVEANGLSINSIYISSNELNEAALKGMTVTLSGNKIKLGNDTVYAENFGEVTKKVQSTKNIIVIDGDGKATYDTTGNFPENTEVYEAVKYEYGKNATVSYDDVTISVNDAITILSKNDAPNNAITEEFIIGEEPTDVSELLVMTKGGVKPGQIVRIGVDKYGIINIPGQVSAGTGLVKNTNFYVSANKIYIPAAVANTKYAVVLSSNVANLSVKDGNWESVSQDGLLTFKKDFDSSEIKKSTEYRIANVVPRVGDQFANFAVSSIFKTGETITITVTPFATNNKQFTVNKKYDVDAFELRATSNNSAPTPETASLYVDDSEVHYYVDKKISENAPAKKGTYTLSVDGVKLKDDIEDDNEYILAEPKEGSITVISKDTDIVLSLRNGVYYYSEDITEATTFLVKTDGAERDLANNKMTFKYSEKAPVSSDDLKETGAEELSANKTFYVRAETEIDGETVSSNDLAVTVAKLPISVNAYYNYYSVQNGEYDTKAIKDSAVYVTEAVDVELVAEKNINTSVANSSIISKNTISANFDTIDLTKSSVYRYEKEDEDGNPTGEYLVGTDPQGYTLDKVTLLDDNYELTESDYSLTGSGYYVLPSVTVEYRDLATNLTCSDNKVVSSNAAKSINTYRQNNRESVTFDNDDVTLSVTLPENTTTSSTKKKLDKWYIGHGNIVDSYNYKYPGNEWNITNDAEKDDIVFYASYINYLGKEDADKYGALEIGDIAPVPYTGNKHITDLSSLYGNYYSGWDYYNNDKSGSKYYTKWAKNNAKTSINADVDLRIYSPSANETLIEGRDYTVTFKNNVNAFQNEDNLSETDKKFTKKAPTIIIKYKGDYKGRANDTLYFRINPMDMGDYYKAALKTTAVKVGAKASSIKAVVERRGNSDYYKENAKKAKLTAKKEYRLNVYNATMKVLRDSKGDVSQYYYIKGSKVEDTGKLSTRGSYLVEVEGVGNYAGTIAYGLQNGKYYGYSEDFDDYKALTVFAYDPKQDIDAKKVKITFKNPSKGKNTYEWNDDETKRVVSADVTYKKTTLSVNKQYVVAYGDTYVSAGKNSYVINMVPDATASQTYYGAKSQVYNVKGAKLGKASASNNLISFNGKSHGYGEWYDDDWYEGDGKLYEAKVEGVPKTETKNGKTIYNWYVTDAKDYANHVLPGTYKMKVVGQGKYYGSTKTYTVKIDKATINASDITFTNYSTNSGNKLDSATADILSGDYAKSGAKPDGRYTLKIGDFSQTYTKGGAINYGDLNSNPFITFKFSSNKSTSKDGKLTIKAVSKYAKLSSAISKTFKINAQDLAWGDVYLNYVTGGKTDGASLAKSKQLQVFDEEGNLLKYNKDYTIKKELSTNKIANSTVSGAESAYIQIEGKGNYKGTNEDTGKVLLGDLTKAKVTLDSSKTIGSYTGDDYTDKIKVTVTVDGKTLSANQDYQIKVTKGKNLDSIDDNEKANATYAGNVKVIITGVDSVLTDKNGFYGDHKYTAKKTVSFKISK